jgi:hypothetical protein
LGEAGQFFTVTGKEPVRVTAADVFGFLAGERGDGSVTRRAVWLSALHKPRLVWHRI